MAGKRAPATSIRCATDDLPGDHNSPDHSYVALMLANIRTMGTALGGDISAAATIDPNNVAP